MRADPAATVPAASFGRDPAFLIPLVTLMLTLRVPGAWLAMGLAGAVLIVTRRELRPGATTVLLAYAVCFLAALGAAVALGLGLNPSGFAWPALAYGLFTTAVVATGDRRANARGLLIGLLSGFTFALLMAIAELATGWRLVALSASHEAMKAIADNPLRTAAYFANYNDFSVALALYAIILVTWLLFRPALAKALPKALRVGRLVAAAGASGLVVVMGSRGALLTLLVGVGVAVLMAARARHSTLVTFPRLGVVALLLAPVAWLAWRSPYFQDSSTTIREEILTKAESLLDAQPVAWLLGFGSQDNYDELTQWVFPWQLMNPHNLILEVVIGYGLVGLTVLGLTWVQCTLAGVTTRRPMHWMLPAFTAAAVAIPVMGVVPSSILPYGFIQVIIAGLAAMLADQRERSVPPNPDVSVPAQRAR